MKKRIFSIIVLVIFLLSNTLSFGAEFSGHKSETIYVNLDTYGKATQINTYSEYLLENVGEVEDYAKYESVEAISSNVNKTTDGNVTKWNTNGLNRLTYMGKMSPDNYSKLPWSIDISYELNGKSANSESLLGQKGLVKVIIDVVPNENADSYYRNNYMMEIKNSFDMDEYISVKSEEATEAVTGATKSLTWVVLPGQKKTLTLEIGSEDFKMDGFTIAMIPLQGDIYDLIKEIADQKEDIEKAFDSTNESLDVLLNEMRGMNSSLNKMIDGTNGIKSGVTDIKGLSDTRNKNLETLKTNLNQLSDLGNKTIKNTNDVQDDIKDLNGILEKLNAENAELRKDMSKLSKDLDKLDNSIDDVPEDLDKFNLLIENANSALKATEELLDVQFDAGNFDSTTLKKNLVKIATNTEAIGTAATNGATSAYTAGDIAGYTAYAGIGSNAQNIGDALQKVQKELNKMDSLVGNASDVSKKLVRALKNLELSMTDMQSIVANVKTDIPDLQKSVNDVNNTVNDLESSLKIISDYANKFLNDENTVFDSLDNLKDLVTRLQNMKSTVNNMITNIQSGLAIIDTSIYDNANTLADGVIDVLNSGVTITSEANTFMYAKNVVRDILKNRWNRIDDKTTLFNVDPDAKAVSFTSTENSSPDKVQFILKTDAIKTYKSKDISDLEPAPEKLSIWQKIGGIFMKIFNWIIGLFS